MRGTITVDEAVAAMARWLQIRATWALHASVVNSATVDHSALLRRLLSGKEPLPTPPPRNGSYPWYAIVDDECHDHVMAEPTDIDSRAIFIEQYPWRVVEKRSEDAYIVTCAAVSHRYRLWCHPPSEWSEHARANRHFGWKMKREEKPCTPLPPI